MKKILLAILTLSIGLGIYGCADEETPNTITEVDLDNPDTIVGSYNIHHFILQDESTVLTNISNTSAEDYASVTSLTQYDGGNTNYTDTAISDQKISIQKHTSSGDTIYSVVVQLHLNSTAITSNAGNVLQNSAYRHLLFPIEQSYFPDGWGTDAVSKATERGLTSFIINRPYGYKENTNMYIQRVATETLITTTEDGDVEETQLLVLSLKTDDGKTYIYKLVKTSDTSGNYVSLVNQGIIQAGVSAVSSLFNSLNSDARALGGIDLPTE